MRPSLLVAACSLLAAACGPHGPDREHVETLFLLDSNRLPAPPAAAALQQLGAALFERPLGGVACAHCHPRAEAGQDGKVHGRNTPALADVARQTLFGRDGGETSLAGMVARELARHHGIGDDPSLRAAVQGDEVLVRAFAAAAGDEAPTRARAAEAIAAHLGTWRSRGRWDRYVEGDDAALDGAEREGVATFLAVGCATCHGGRNLGGVSLHLLGLAVPFPGPDPGREAVTGKAADRRVFKAPMLRHAARTPPYLHDGSVVDLADAVRRMGRHELGKELAPGEVAAIVTMLRAVAEVDAPVAAAASTLESGHAR